MESWLVILYWDDIYVKDCDAEVVSQRSWGHSQGTEVNLKLLVSSLRQSSLIKRDTKSRSDWISLSVQPRRKTERVMSSTRSSSSPVQRQWDRPTDRVQPSTEDYGLRSYVVARSVSL